MKDKPCSFRIHSGQSDQIPKWPSASSNEWKGTNKGSRYLHICGQIQPNGIKSLYTSRRCSSIANDNIYVSNKTHRCVTWSNRTRCLRRSWSFCRAKGFEAQTWSPCLRLICLPWGVRWISSTTRRRNWMGNWRTCKAWWRTTNTSKSSPCGYEEPVVAPTDQIVKPDEQQRQ